MNEQLAVKKYGYGPISSTRAFWKDKAERWNVDLHTAMMRRCGNCEAYDTSKACKKQGLASEDGLKGYCRAHDFVAELTKVCDTWVPLSALIRENPRISRSRSALIGQRLGVNFHRIPASEWYMGMNVEMEHGLRDKQTNVTSDDPYMTGKIAWAHLKEMPDYYTRLDRMEQEGKRAQKRREKQRANNR